MLLILVIDAIIVENARRNASVEMAGWLAEPAQSQVGHALTRMPRGLSESLKREILDSPSIIR